MHLEEIKRFADSDIENATTLPADNSARSVQVSNIIYSNLSNLSI